MDARRWRQVTHTHSSISSRCNESHHCCHIFQRVFLDVRRLRQLHSSSRRSTDSHKTSASIAMSKEGGFPAGTQGHINSPHRFVRFLAPEDDQDKHHSVPVCQVPPDSSSSCGDRRPYPSTQPRHVPASQARKRTDAMFIQPILFFTLLFCQ